jgi:hypothetical protein
MAARLDGARQLNARLTAVKNVGSDILEAVGLRAVLEQKKLAPVATGNLRRTIHLGTVTRRSALTVAGANYSADVELGTRPHVILPRKRGGVLRWKDGAQVRFAKRVQHPGTRAQPFMVPGAQKAIREGSAIADAVIRRWNGAA